MDLQMTQIIDEDKANDENDDDTKVGILCVGPTEHSIVKGFTKIGRSPALCQIIVDERTVSKVHAEIQAGCETVFISDLRSANGTKIKDVSLKPFFYYTINDGDAIYFGSVKAIFKTNKSSQHSPSIFPATPIPSRRVNETNTQDLGNASDVLFNNTSAYQSDDSVIPGTQQKKKKLSVFQEPSAPVDSRRQSNIINSVSASTSEKTIKEKKLQNDVDFTDLHDLETQQFNAFEPSKSDKSKRNDKSTKSQDKLESTDVYDLETQKMDYESILDQSRAKKKPRSENNEQFFDDTNMYEAETQILSLPTEKEQRKNEKKIDRSRLNDSIASSGRSYNSSSNFSKLLQISASPSPPPSPNPLDDNGDIIESQNLLEMCETPLLELEKKDNGSGTSGECSKLKNSVKSDLNMSEKNSGGKSNSNLTENINNRNKSDPSNHVIAESDDESATDDDLDIETTKANAEIKKFEIAAKPSDVIEDDSATDDEGHFESLAMRSPPKEERKLSLKMLRKTTEDRNDEKNVSDAETQKIEQKKFKLSGAKFRKETTDDRDIEENIFEAETQRMDKKKYKLSGAKFRKETTNDCNAETNIFDAETQRIDEENVVDVAAKKNQKIAEDTEAKKNKIDKKMTRMELKLGNIVVEKKRRQLAEEHDNEPNIFEAETQLMDLEIPAEVVAKKRREITENRENKANIFDAETQQMDLETAKVNIFEVATQRIYPKSPREIRANNLRELEKNRQAKSNIFDAETQQMDLIISEVAKPKKRRQIAANSETDANIFEVATQKIDVESTGEVRAKKRRESAEKRTIETNIFDAATQPMNDDISDIVKPKKRRDLVKTMHEDSDIDLLPTQVLDVPTSTPVSRSRKLKEQQFKKKISSKTDEDLHSAATQIIKDWDDIIDESSTEDSTVASPKLRTENTENNEDKQAKVQNSMSVSRSPKSKGQKKMKSHRFEMKNDSETSPKRITENFNDSTGKKSSRRSAGGNSSLGDENTGEQKNNRSVNLDETLMRNLGIILDQEANNQELVDESEQLMTQNLVDILKPTQSFEENKSRDSEDEITDDMRATKSPEKKKKEKFRSPSILGFVDGQAVSCDTSSDEDVPKVAAIKKDDKKGDEEKNEKKNQNRELSEWLDPDSILFGLPEVRISGTLSNPGSPSSSTTSSHKDFVVPNSREAEKSAKSENKVALSCISNRNSPKTVEAVKSMEFDSPIVQKKSRIAMKRIAKKIIEDEDQDSDETFAYNDLKKMADDLLASGSVSSTKTEKKDHDIVAEELEKISTTGRQLRHVRNDFSSINDADYCRRTRKLAKPSSSLLVSDFNDKRSAEDTTMNIEGESSSSGAKRISKRVTKSTKTANSRSKAVNKQGKESQEVEEILAAMSNENLPIATKRSFVKVQLTRIDDSDISQQSSANEKVATPKTNRKRRATMSAKDVTPAASPVSAKSRKTISEGVQNRTLPKQQHKILLTGLKEEHTKLAKKLGGLVVSEPSKATVLITDKVRRTYKFLCAVARGLRVVSLNWLLESQKVSRFLDCDDFILNDPAAEESFKFRLVKSLETARTNKFLQGYTIIVTPKVNQPEIHELKGMIEASGGKVLTRAPGARAWNAKTVIVSREEDRTAINALLSKCPKTVKITVQSVEFILSGILRQEVDLVEHKLDIP